MRNIVHLDLDTFFVSVERLRNPALNAKPVVIGGISDRGVVAGCSYEARKFGIHSAMPIKMARSLCPGAVFMKGDREAYSNYSDLVTEVIADRAPAFEKASIDEHYLDITGMDRFFGAMKWTQELRYAIIKETGLPISFGLSVNKTVAKIATGEAKPSGEINIAPGNVRSFLDPLPVQKMPMVGEKTYRTLRTLGVGTIGALGRIPPEAMLQAFGKNGLVLWQKANGEDETPVYQSWEQKSLSSERTFERDIFEIQYLRSFLLGMVEKLCYELRSQQKLTGCVTVKLRYSNFDTETKQRRVGYTSMDHQLSALVLELFDSLYQRRMRIRLVGVRFSHLIRGTQQLALFDDSVKMAKLYQQVDYIRDRFGVGAIKRGGAKPSTAAG